MSIIASYPSEEQTLLIDSASRFLKAHEAKFLREACAASERALTSLWKEIASMGWTRLIASEQGSGLGMSTLDGALICEQAGRHLLPLPLPIAMAVAALLDEAGTGLAPIEGPLIDTLQQWLDGDRLLGIVQGQDGNEPVWLEYACVGDALVVDNSPQELQLALKASGMTGQGLDPAISTGTTAPGPAQTTVSLPCTATTKQRYTLRTRLLRCAELLGTGHAALDAAVNYACEREQFGKPIGSQQAIKHRLAENWMALDDAGLLLRDACEITDAAASPEAIRDAVLAAAMAEIAAIDAATATTRQALQTFGAMGITWECPVHRYLKRAKHHQLVLSTEHAPHDLLQALWEAG